jgi:histidinol-phosphate phosphatase family protein
VDVTAPLLLVPRQAEPFNREALAAWHRARGGVTLVMDGSEWTGAAAIDRALVAASHTPDELTLPLLHALGPINAISFPGAASVRVAFLDRDGTIMVDRDYLSDPAGVELLPGAAEGLRLLCDRGIRLVVVSNQSGVGSGRISPEQLAQVNARLTELLGAEGVLLNGTYCCIHRSDAGCDCRKPLPGLALQAASDLGLDPSRGIVVGDKPADIGLARALGIPSFLTTTGSGSETLNAGAVAADYVVDGLAQLARICTHPAGLARPTAPALP